MAFGAESVLPMKLSKHGGSYMNLLNLLILALACLIGMLIIKRALERTKKPGIPMTNHVGIEKRMEETHAELEQKS
jgi:hypothetical protein